MAKMTKECLICKVPFQVEVGEHNRGQGKYCSKICANTSMKGVQRKITPQPNCICSTCNKPIYKSLSRKQNSKHGLHFCNRRCKETAQQIGGINEIQPAHYGTGKRTYREIVKRETGFTCCENCKWDLVPEILEVHHIDRNRENNDISNLQVLCPTCHTLVHYKATDGRYGKKVPIMKVA